MWIISIIYLAMYTKGLARTWTGCMAMCCPTKQLDGAGLEHFMSEVFGEAEWKPKRGDGSRHIGSARIVRFL